MMFLQFRQPVYIRPSSGLFIGQKTKMEEATIFENSKNKRATSVTCGNWISE